MRCAGLYVLGFLSCLFVGVLMGTYHAARLENDLKMTKIDAEAWQMVATESDAQVRELREQVANLEQRLEVQWVRHCTITAYSARPCETDDTPTVTAFMTKVREGTIAVSRDLFSQGWVKGKKVHVWGYGVFEINDLMGETKTIKGKKVPIRNAIDIFLWDTKKASNIREFNVQVALLD